MTGRESHERGTTTEAVAVAEFERLGLTVSLPFGRPRYDAIVDDAGTLHRAQIKPGRYVEDEGVIRFNCRSTHINSAGNTSRSYNGDVDAFVVYSGCTDEVYWVDVEDAGARGMALRVDEPDFDHPPINYASEFRHEGTFGK